MFMLHMHEQKVARHLLYSALIVLIAVGTFLNSLAGGFIWDDRGLIVDNASYLSDWKNLFVAFIEPLFGETPYYRPLLVSSFIIDYQLWGTNPFGYHVSNLMFHVLNSLLVYLFIFLLLKKAHLAFLSSLLFTVHPVQSEAVAWISGRNDLLLTFFALGSCILHIYRNALQGWKENVVYACCLLAYMGAILSKESGIVLPLLFMLIDCFFQTLRRESIKVYVAIVLISIGYCLVKLMVIGGVGVELHASSIAAALPTVLVTYTYYFKMLLFPVSQAAVPVLITPGSMDQSVLLHSSGLFSIVVITAVLSVKKYKELSFAILWVLIALLPVCGIIPLALPALEHRLYLGSVCFSMLLPCGVYWLSSRASLMMQPRMAKTMGPLLIPIVLIIYTAKTVTRNHVWNNAHSFWAQAVQDAPDSAIARNNLGIAYAAAGEHQRAIQEFKSALALCDHKDGVDSDDRCVQQGKLFHNLGRSYYRLLQEEVADGNAESTGAAEKRSHKNAIGGRTRSLSALSYNYYKRALMINPERAETYNNLGDLFYVMQNFPAAEKEYRSALMYDSDNAEYYNNLGLTYYALSNYPQAEQQLSRAISLQPNYLEARNNLALVHMKRGMYLKALDELERIVLSKPDHYGVYVNLALVYLHGFNDRERAAFYLKEGLNVTSYKSPDRMDTATLADVGRDGTRRNRYESSALYRSD